MSLADDINRIDAKVRRLEALAMRLAAINDGRSLEALAGDSSSTCPLARGRFEIVSLRHVPEHDESTLAAYELRWRALDDPRQEIEFLGYVERDLVDYFVAQTRSALDDA